MSKEDLCEYCWHPRKNHHAGCDICQAIPSRHGHYCEGALCACIDFMEPALSDEDLEALMEQA